MDKAILVMQALSIPLTLLIAVLGFRKTETKDARDDGAQVGTMMSELGYIKSGVDDIKTEQREQRGWNEGMATRMAKVEASAAQAHKRLDEIHGEHNWGRQA